MATRRLTLWTLAVVLVAGACSKSEPAVTSSAVTTSAGDAGGEQVLAPTEAAPVTEWERVLSALDDPVPLQTALDAFALAIGPVPGASSGGLPSGFGGSASGPLRWLLGHWDELTAEQQAAVDAALAAWDAGASALGGPVLLGVASPWARRITAGGALPYALVDDMITNIEVLLGRELELTVVLKVAGPEVDDGESWALTMVRNAEGGKTGVGATCTIYFTAKGLAQSGAGLESIVAHEVFHCFQDDLGTLEQAFTRPAWVVEGSAEWAGETIAHGSPTSEMPWFGWLEKFATQSLFARAYSAIGFYSHLTESGVEVWSLLDAALLASDVSSEAAYQVLIAGASEDLVDTWAPGYFRDPAQAPVWDQTGPGITNDAPDIPIGALHDEEAYTVVAAPYAAGFAEIDVQSAAEVVTFESPGEGLAMFADGTTTELEDLHGTVFCTTGACACPEGTPGAGTPFAPLPLGVVQIGATGHVFGSEVTMVGWSLERYCAQERCHVGSWESGVWYVPRVIAGGHGAPLAITRDGEGYVDWSQAADLYGVVQGGTTAGLEILPLKLVLGGGAHFLVEPDGTEMRVVAATGGMSVTPFIDLGDGWFETGEGGAYLNYGSTGAEARFACAGNRMLLNGVIEFWRVSNEAVIPPEFADSTPTTGAGGGGTPTTIGPAPAVDPCALLTVAEVSAIIGPANPPTGPDDLPTDFFSQCTFSPAVAIQVYGPGGPELFTDGADVLGLTIVEVDGIGDWALAQISEPDPTFGIEETVLLAAAGGPAGIVAVIPYGDVYAGTAEFDALFELLELALSRL